MKNTKRSFVAVLLAIGMMSATAFGQSRIGGERWQLSELNGTAVSNSRINIEFDESTRKLAGHSGCNRYFGSYERRGQTFKASGIGSTKMACMRPGLMEAENAFLKALANGTRILRNGKTLSIFAGNDRVLRFRSAGQDGTSTSIGLGSKKWILKSIGNKAVTLHDKLPFVTFDPSKMSVAGNSGCNGFGGNYTANGSELAIGDVISTMMACEADGRMEIERGLFDGLKATNRFEIKRNDLHLYNGARLLLTFEGTEK